MLNIAEAFSYLQVHSREVKTEHITLKDTVVVLVNLLFWCDCHSLFFVGEGGLSVL